MVAPNKCCALDPAQTWLIKQCCGCLTLFVAMMCNGSILEGYLPISQKTAIVMPLIKEEGLDPEVLKNYRPVANLSFISNQSWWSRLWHNKWMASSATSGAYHQINQHISSFIPQKLHYSKSLMVLPSHRIVARAHCWVSLTSVQPLTLLIMPFLKGLLENTLGIRSFALKWLSSYLMDHTQHVVFDAKFVSEIVFIILF